MFCFFFGWGIRLHLLYEFVDFVFVLSLAKFYQALELFLLSFFFVSFLCEVRRRIYHTPYPGFAQQRRRRREGSCILFSILFFMLLNFRCCEAYTQTHISVLVLLGCEANGH